MHTKADNDFLDTCFDRCMDYISRGQARRGRPYKILRDYYLRTIVFRG